MKRNQWAAALLAVLLFACGVVVGALGHRYYAGAEVVPRTAEVFRQHYVSEMKSKLKLTPAQLDQLETILDDTKAKYKAVRDSFRPAMVQIKNDQITRVKAILTPQQAALYDRLVAERERRAREQEERDRKEEEQREAARRHGP